METSTHQPRSVWKGLRQLILLVVAGIACVGCERAADAGTSAGPESAPDAAEPRIAALLPFAADQLIELGVTPVAVPLLRSDVPDAWGGVPAITLDHSAGPNLEQLMASDPDYVVTSSVYAQFLPAMEQSTGAEVILMDVDSIEDVAGHVAKLGEIANRPEEAAALMSSIEDRMASEIDHDQTVRVLAVFGTPHAFYAFLPSSYLGDLVAHAGGEMITDDMQSHGVFRGLAPLSMEAVIDRDPDHLLVIFHGSEASARAMLERDGLWGQLPAVREGHVTFLKDDLYAMRPGSEMPRAIGDIKMILDEARLQLN